MKNTCWKGEWKRDRERREENGEKGDKAKIVEEKEGEKRSTTITAKGNLDLQR